MTRSGDVLLGKLNDGTRVYVSVELEPLEVKPRQTVTHETVDGSGGYRLSIQAHTVRKGCKSDNWESAGQLVDTVKALPADVRPRQLLANWERWHLNDMRAACEHIDVHELGEVCPASGYRYGSAWLYEPLPAGVITWATQFITDHP